MRALIQRVSRAAVRVNGRVVGEIGRGLLVFLCVMRGDEDADLDTLTRKIAGMRIFSNEAGKPDLSVGDVSGAILLVSQFTLAASTRKGRRPSFSDAAPPAEAERLCAMAAGMFERSGLPVATGEFGAMMEVELVNDGPVTIWLDTRDSA